MTQPARLLRDTEQYLSALHGSVARHDNLAANYGCAGCELRDRIGAVLRAASAGVAPATGSVSCPFCADRTLTSPTDAREHYTQEHPEQELVGDGPWPLLRAEPATDRAEAVASCPGRELDPNPCRCPCYGCKHHCAAHDPDELPDAAPAADRAALRDRIAEALHGDQTPAPALPWAEELPLDREYFLRRADAVLSVLPASVDRAAILRDFQMSDARELTATHRAHVLREAADAVDSGKQSFPETVRSGASWAARMLRRMADETQQPETEAPCCSDPTCRCNQVDAAGRCECAKWDSTPADEPQPGVVHGCPPDGSGLTPCCGRTPFELPLTDRISSEAPVTCPGPAADQRQQPKEA